MQKLIMYVFFFDFQKLITYYTNFKIYDSPCTEISHLIHSTNTTQHAFIFMSLEIKIKHCSLTYLSQC